MRSVAPLAAACLLAHRASAFTTSSSGGRSLQTALPAKNGIWNTGNDFGKGDFRFYEDLESFMKPFPPEDREEFPQYFKLPKGVYEVKLATPCGIMFEEIEPGKGVYVQDLVEGYSAERQGVIQKDDVLVGITAIQIAGAKWERRMLPCRYFGFDMVVGAIGSNEPKWGCDNVVMLMERPGEADPEEVDKWLEYFEPPKDTPWKLSQ